VSQFFSTGSSTDFYALSCCATPGIPHWQYLRITIGLLFIACVIVHVESHLADFTMEASFMPILKKNKYLKCEDNVSAEQDGYRRKVF
jgi:hypothetical protein